MTILFEDCRVFDGASAEPREGATVVVEGGRIREVAEGAVSAPADARRVACGGRTLMPGLIDAHFHACLADLGLALAVERGLIAGPCILFAGRGLSQTGGHGDMRSRTRFEPCGCAGYHGRSRGSPTGVNAVRLAAREELRKGAHQIKMMVSGGVLSPADPIWMDQYSDEEIRAGVEEAATRRTYVMAARAHGEFGTLLRGPRRPLHRARHPDRRRSRGSRGRSRRLRGADAGDDLRDDRVRRALWAARDLCREAREPGRGGPALARDLPRGRGADGLRHRPARAAAGPAEPGVPDLLAPIDVLRSATSVNAALIKREGELGTIAPGAVADILVVDGDPLADLGLLQEQGRHLPAIMKDGRFCKNTL